jgi:hypothetical protein
MLRVQSMKIVTITGNTERCRAKLDRLMQQRIAIEVHGDYQHDKTWLRPMIEGYGYSIRATNLTPSSDLTTYYVEPAFNPRLTRGH